VNSAVRPMSSPSLALTRHIYPFVSAWCAILA
jgi:hypothetical protein